MEEGSTLEVGATPAALHHSPTQLQPQDSRAKPTVACVRCRDQKLRCDRELPSCVRCRKQKATCKYPPPPDRKRIAQRTSQARASALASISKSGEHALRLDPPTTAKSRKRQRIRGDSTKENSHCDSVPNPSPGPNSEEGEDDELPSTEVGLLLMEVYFKRVYNATLLFHKAIAFRLYRQNSLPGYLLRAIFAHAAVFLEQVDSPYKQYIKIFPVHTLFEKSWSWARSASHEVLSHADEPTLVRIQALQVLQFYYFSRGETQRAIVHVSLAYRLSQLLGYDRLHEDITLTSTSRSQRFEHEMKRRCFWASWCSSCIGIKQLDLSEACEKVMGLPLPARFEMRGPAQATELQLGQKMQVDWKVRDESLPLSRRMAGSSSCSLMAELVKLLGIWTNVQVFISESSRFSSTQRTTKLEKLVKLFEPIELSLHLPLTDICARAEFYDESSELLTSVCSVYYLSRLLMHASMVPMLSGCAEELLDSRESVRGNLDLALQHACRFAALLQQFVAEDLDITRLWPFIGYGAFVAGSVFMVYSNTVQPTQCANPSVQVPGPNSEEMGTIRTILQVLSLYWKPLRGLATKLDRAIHTGQSSDLGSIVSPTYPWDARLPPEDDARTLPNKTLQNKSNQSASVARTPRVGYLCESQLDQGVGLHESSTESDRSLPEQQVSLRGRASTEREVSQAPDSGYQSALEGSLMNNNGECLFETDWWNTVVPTMNGWEYSPLVEMSRDLILEGSIDSL
ncbi:hypothetical protein GGS23DRAFT_544613 [Durotheca rogersii]|uniref:uncharacterized protein n=1 Tax=Durotheca rogersii TaxID=419775 RepID=UPI00221F17AF|nr:uncharacterized protein GGS23DRAFT_544613 [Durotheca rogersii]KAI5868236.1 hypothetical protein GGS23DRAFT_544613 [Durotheca rogersii]